MKKSFLLFLSLLSTTSFLQAMENEIWENKPQALPKLNKPFKFKTLPMGYVGTYDERSNLGSSSGISYPKIPMIHTDDPDTESSSFGAAFLGNEVAMPLSLKQYLPQKDQFFFLNIQQHDKNGEPLSLKPQYALFPKAPARSQDTQEATVGWTVIPGVEGKIIPEQGETKETLWKETVSIHPTGENNDKLILSGNSMRLQGIDTQKSMDCYSFIDADKASLVTYHWMLTPHDFKKFNRVLRGSDTLNELIYNLDKQKFQPNLLKELKKYVLYPQDVQPTLNKPFMSGQSVFQEDYKTLPIGYVKTYNERSKLYSSSGVCYPKIPMIHTYEQDSVPPPFGAVFLGNEVAMPLSLKQYLSQKDQFFFLNIQQHEKNERPRSLKPQYALFPDAPATGQVTQEATVGWTVVPGVEGKIIPTQGATNQDLLKQAVSVHPKGEAPYPDEIVLSGDVMHLQGINTEKSMDCYSFIDADKASLVTYHWMLTPHDFKKFNQLLSISDTLNELIHNLDKQQFHPNLLKELKRYVQYQDVQPKLNKPFITGEQVLGDGKILQIDHVRTYNEKSEFLEQSDNLDSEKKIKIRLLKSHVERLTNDRRKMEREAENTGYEKNKSYKVFSEEKEKWISNVKMKEVATEQLKKINELENLFLIQIREDHQQSQLRDKGVLGLNDTLQDVMDKYGESSMSITKAFSSPKVMQLISELFACLYGEITLSFQEARQKFVEQQYKIVNMNCKIVEHLRAVSTNGDHESFPYLGMFTRMYCQIVEDLSSFLYSQGDACMNGLNGRMGFVLVDELFKKKLEDILKEKDSFSEKSTWKNNLTNKQEEEVLNLSNVHFSKREEEENQKKEKFKKLIEKYEAEIKKINQYILNTEKEIKKLSSSLKQDPNEKLDEILQNTSCSENTRHLLKSILISNKELCTGLIKIAQKDALEEDHQNLTQAFYKLNVAGEFLALIAKSLHLSSEYLHLDELGVGSALWMTLSMHDENYYTTRMGKQVDPKLYLSSFTEENRDEKIQEALSNWKKFLKEEKNLSDLKEGMKLLSSGLSKKDYENKNWFPYLKAALSDTDEVKLLEKAVNPKKALKEEFYVLMEKRQQITIELQKLEEKQQFIGNENFEKEQWIRNWLIQNKKMQKAAAQQLKELKELDVSNNAEVIINNPQKMNIIHKIGKCVSSTYEVNGLHVNNPGYLKMLVPNMEKSLEKISSGDEEFYEFSAWIDDLEEKDKVEAEEAANIHFSKEKENILIEKYKNELKEIEQKISIIENNK